jgi:hypothetical protein
MPKKTFQSRKLDMAEMLDALQTVNRVKLSPPVREAQKPQWDALTGALLMQRCDLLVKQASTDGSRYLRVRGKATHAKITQQLSNAAIEYVMRPSAATPKWAED